MAVDGFRPRPGVTATCPFCGSTRTTEIGAFASVAMTAYFQCGDCRSPFEWVRWRRKAPPAGGARPRH